jgi:GTP pyrophosphokinase
MFAAIGRGEVGQRVLQTALRGRPPGADAATPPLPPAFSDAAAPSGRAGGILVVGMDRLLTQLAKCCHPLPPEPIIGFVTRGKGVSIHRQDCPNVRQLPEERRLEACWGDTRGEARFQADVEVAGEGGGLLRSAVEALARERIPVRAARTAGRGATERVRLSVDVADDAQLQRVLASLRVLPGVAAARRC